MNNLHDEYALEASVLLTKLQMENELEFISDIMAKEHGLTEETNVPEV